MTLPRGRVRCVVVRDIFGGRAPDEIVDLQVVELLGLGGQAYVYKVRGDEDSPCFAFKVFKGDRVLAAGLRERVDREIGAIQRGSAVEGVARFFLLLQIRDEELGDHPDNGSFAVVTEYVEGESLEQRLVDASSSEELREHLVKPRPSEEVFELGRRLFEIVEHLHEVDVCHCDIKPQNIIIRARDARPFLIDFGISNLDAPAEPDEPDEDDPSASTSRRGTPGYLPIDASDAKSADVFACAVTLYRCLTGAWPPASRVHAPSRLPAWWRRALGQGPPLTYRWALARLLDGPARHKPQSAVQARASWEAAERYRGWSVVIWGVAALVLALFFGLRFEPCPADEHRCSWLGACRSEPCACPGEGGRRAWGLAEGARCVDTLEAETTEHCGGLARRRLDQLRREADPEGWLGDPTCQLEDAICVEGRCACRAGFEACEGGCRPASFFVNNDQNCGECGNACDSHETCMGTSCSGDCKRAGMVRCGGACVDPLTNPVYCGVDEDCEGVDTVCEAFEICERGRCVCAEGLERVQGVSLGTSVSSLLDPEPEACIDPRSNELACGPARERCGPGHLCIGEEGCVLNCPAGLSQCEDHCVDLSSDEAHCGTTCEDATRCESHERCVAGRCRPRCARGQSSCEGVCINPLVNEAHCGTPGTSCDELVACKPGEDCIQGSCRVVCPEGLADCRGVCVDPRHSPEHCGADAACRGGQRCGRGEVCAEGECRCPGGTVEYGEACVDPQTSSTHCGTPPEDCAQSGKLCLEGRCRCAPGYRSVDGVCIRRCDPACESGKVCVAGKCAQRCERGELRCSDGCFRPDTDGHCGSCDPCGADERCVKGRCEPSGDNLPAEDDDE